MHTAGIMAAERVPSRFERRIHEESVGCMLLIGGMGSVRIRSELSAHEKLYGRERLLAAPSWPVRVIGRDRGTAAKRRNDWSRSLWVCTGEGVVAVSEMIGLKRFS